MYRLWRHRLCSSVLHNKNFCSPLLFTATKTKYASEKKIVEESRCAQVSDYLTLIFCCQTTIEIEVQYFLSRVWFYAGLRGRNHVLGHLELCSARLPVKVYKTLNGWQSYILTKFHKIVDKIMLKCISGPEAADPTNAWRFSAKAV